MKTASAPLSVCITIKRTVTGPSIENSRANTQTKKMEDAIRQSLVRALTSSPKHIPTWYNYDDVGSELQFQCTTDIPDYYLCKSDRALLENRIQDIIPRVPYDVALVDLGSGNCSKTRLVIDELLTRQNSLTFYPLDISEEFLLKSMKKLSEEYDDSLIIKPIAANYVQGIDNLKQITGPKIILWFDSIINLSYDDQVDTLRLISTMMSDKCRLVFSADVTLDREEVLNAYNDDAGVMQRFISYAMTRLNKEAGSNIDLARFTYEVDFISYHDPQSMSYVRAYIRANEDIRYTLPGLGIDLEMEKGECLYFHEGDGFSCKYSLEQLRTIVEKAGLRLAESVSVEQRHAAFCVCTAV
ncbi:histidine N-alpha-methyltransferase-like isoform X2 [Pecten maximus]|uniref:histidine N-alpha-methyltransferase-like isoform X2 n=1 Tax=Pecten maximus TaxID=6579 RepID=UPI0014585D10|nr:histidine N-alpha-methyltransferase-like isoform X2 [Pecten maximus]